MSHLPTSNTADISAKHHGLLKTALILFSAIWLVQSVQADTQNRGFHRTPITAETEQGEVLSLYKGSFALLIGASRYDSWSSLSSIPRELDDLQLALEGQDFKVERLANPTSESLEYEIESFIDQYGYESENRLLIYFAGHGHSEGDRGFLVPVDAPLPDDRKAFRRSALPMTQMMAWARDIDAKHVLFAFDSCFSGTVFKARNLPGKTERYIRRATNLPVRQFLTAGSAGEVVPARSTFTPALVAAIQGEGDLNKDGYVTGNELGVHLSQLVPRYVNQSPQYGAIRDYELGRGDFVFSYQRAGPDQEKPVVEPINQNQSLSTDNNANRTEELYWQSVQSLNTEAAYLDYLERYPEGEFSSLAGIAISNFVPAPEEQPQPDYAAIEQKLGLNRTQRREVQRRLNHAGYQVGVADGLWGPRTRAGIEQWQADVDLEATGYMDEGSYEVLVAELVLPEPPPPKPARKSFEPEMVRIEGGSFMMGSDDGDNNEKPVHRVQIGSFEMGRYEVTFDEYDAFANATGRDLPDDGGWGRGRRPVINVSWIDAQAYIAWLNENTSGGYRLPSESEWEYAAGAGSRGTYSFGDSHAELCTYGNGDTNYNKECNDRHQYTAPVGSYRPNGNGLSDMHGNVWEWVEDCWHKNYQGAPATGRAWLSEGGGNCGRRVLRGGSWYDVPDNLRSANRYWFNTPFPYINAGFRVSRTLTP